MRASKPIVRDESTAPEAARLLVLSSLTPAAIRAANINELKMLQKVARLGDTWGAIEIPSELGTGRSTPPLMVERRMPKGLEAGTRGGDHYVTEVMRAAISMALLPTRQGRPNKHTTIRCNLSAVLNMLATKPFSSKGGRMWANLIVDSTTTSSSRSSVKALGYYSRLGCLPDAPSFGPRIVGQEGPRDRSGEAEHSSRPASPKMIQPFSDQFVTEAGWAASNMIQLVGPTLLDAIEAALKVKPKEWSDRGPRRRLKGYGLIAAARDPVIRGWRWRGPDGKPLTSVPLEFHIKQGSSRFAASWPPRTFDHAMRMVQILQGAHTFPIGLATGNRHGEMFSLQIGSLSRLKGGTNTVRFRTWKSEGPGGRSTDAPVPSLACSAILQQERLSRIFSSYFGVTRQGLWTSLMRPDRTPSITYLMETFVDGLGLRKYVDRGGVSPQRYRKTLARLAALALVHAPKVLMDAFGHRDEQTTVMRYILADPETLDTVQEIVQEMIILKGVEAIEKADTIQGAGSDLLKKRVELFARRLGQSSLEPSNIAEFARAMTENGTSWAFVAPGIVCTSFKTGGLCNKGRGSPDPHYCSPACENQLVFPEDAGRVGSAVMNAIETVEYALGLLETAIDEEDEMLIAQYRGQLRSLLHRWREVDAHCASSTVFKKLVPDVVLIV